MTSTAAVLVLESAPEAPAPVPAPPLAVDGAGDDSLDACWPRAGGPFVLANDCWPPIEAQRWRVVLGRGATGDCVALSDAAVAPMLQERLEAVAGSAVRFVRCPSPAIDDALARAFSGFRALSAIEADREAASSPSAAAPQVLRLDARAGPVVRLLDATLFDALQDGASDIHFEATPAGLAIRYRLDGVMLPVRRIDGVLTAEQIVSRLKVMAELDIGERRLPQDGRFQLECGGRRVDFRLSVMPSIHGEDAVVRILDRSRMGASPGALSLESLGFDVATCRALLRLARQPHGMLLVTGPTGSGKTTTLYAALTQTSSADDKVVTIEDPVEYQLAGVLQIPVNEKKGLTFARGLRSILRHDPDRVMVGEIRDPETAQIAVQAALTGHLVFSTIHANSCLDVIGRFMHMGLDLYSLGSALNAVLAQRLVRVNCSHCRRPDTSATAGGRPMRGIGCRHCRGTGFRGRRAVAELLPLDDELRDLIAGRSPLGRIRQAMADRGIVALREVALALVAAGETTREEVDRVTLGN